jgi:hypothetical protein
MIAELFRMCNTKEWSRVRRYLSSNAAEKEKKSNIMYHEEDGWTCLHLACHRDAPDDIIGAMIDIGGTELVMKIDMYDNTVIHSACLNAASYDVIEILINVGGKDLVMAKNKYYGNTALHDLCRWIDGDNYADEIIKVFLEVGDANLLLSTKNHDGKTPFDIATDKGASNIIKKLLTVQSNSNSTISNNSSSAFIVLADNSTSITQSNQDQDTTRRTSTNNDPNIPIRGLGIDQNHQSQLREELQLSKDSTHGEDSKRKHSNEDGSVSISQSQSSKRSKVEIAANISSVTLNTNQAEDDDDDAAAAVIAGQHDQYNTLMSWCTALRRELRSAKAQIVDLKNRK